MEAILIKLLELNRRVENKENNSSIFVLKRNRGKRGMVVNKVTN